MKKSHEEQRGDIVIIISSTWFVLHPWFILHQIIQFLLNLLVTKQLLNELFMYYEFPMILSYLFLQTYQIVNSYMTGRDLQRMLGNSTAKVGFMSTNEVRFLFKWIPRIWCALLLTVVNGLKLIIFFQKII